MKNVFDTLVRLFFGKKNIRLEWQKQRFRNLKSYCYWVRYKDQNITIISDQLRGRVTLTYRKNELLHTYNVKSVQAAKAKAQELVNDYNFAS